MQATVGLRWRPDVGLLGQPSSEAGPLAGLWPGGRAVPGCGRESPQTTEQLGRGMGPRRAPTKRLRGGCSEPGRPAWGCSSSQSRLRGRGSELLEGPASYWSLCPRPRSHHVGSTCCGCHVAPVRGQPGVPQGTSRRHCGPSICQNVLLLWKELRCRSWLGQDGPRGTVLMRGSRHEGCVLSYHVECPGRAAPRRQSTEGRLPGAGGWGVSAGLGW